MQLKWRSTATRNAPPKLLKSTDDVSSNNYRTFSCCHTLRLPLDLVSYIMLLSIQTSMRIVILLIANSIPFHSSDTLHDQPNERQIHSSKFVGISLKGSRRFQTRKLVSDTSLAFGDWYGGRSCYGFFRGHLLS